MNRFRLLSVKWIARVLCLLLCAVCLCAAVSADDPVKMGQSDPESPNPRVAITFDDGPHPVYTPEILALLEQYGVRATFFVIGQNVQTHPDLVKQEIAAGHEVGNHTLSHPNLHSISSDDLIKQLRQTDDIIYTLTQTHPTLFRPPTGLCTSAVRQAASRMHYDLILWSVDTRDWSKKTSLDHIISEVKNNVRDGSIILFHDFTVRNDHATVRALEVILPYLKEQGYRFVTVSELLDTAQPR